MPHNYYVNYEKQKDDDDKNYNNNNKCLIVGWNNILL